MNKQTKFVALLLLALAAPTQAQTETNIGPVYTKLAGRLVGYSTNCDLPVKRVLDYQSSAARVMREFDGSSSESKVAAFNQAMRATQDEKYRVFEKGFCAQVERDLTNAEASPLSILHSKFLAQD